MSCARPLCLGVGGLKCHANPADVLPPFSQVVFLSLTLQYKFDALITTYEMVLKDAEVLRPIRRAGKGSLPSWALHGFTAVPLHGWACGLRLAHHPPLHSWR